jgi:hypothetical protein
MKQILYLCKAEIFSIIILTVFFKAQTNCKDKGGKSLIPHILSGTGVHLFFVITTPDPGDSD